MTRLGGRVGFLVAVCCVARFTWLNFGCNQGQTLPSEYVDESGVKRGPECVEGLTLRVDHERPAAGVGHDDGVVDGERVDWQPCQLPRAALHRVTQSVVQHKLVTA